LQYQQERVVKKVLELLEQVVQVVWVQVVKLEPQ
jgi:hypothetical protein